MTTKSGIKGIKTEKMKIIKSNQKYPDDEMNKCEISKTD
ncbi:MAG: hypothetical protein A4E26_01829 [Methanobacterium sp. PtaU1.Bin097]|jgi:hypothetical protein|nr:MAG: hypothetical protein A4E26_01829 [Methanobacterium sp. PtaU1.Bin097]